jgi:hypothetical protein
MRYRILNLVTTDEHPATAWRRAQLGGVCVMLFAPFLSFLDAFSTTQFV